MESMTGSFHDSPFHTFHNGLKWVLEKIQQFPRKIVGHCTSGPSLMLGIRANSSPQYIRQKRGSTLTRPECQPMCLPSDLTGSMPLCLPSSSYNPLFQNNFSDSYIYNSLNIGFPPNSFLRKSL